MAEAALTSIAKSALQLFTSLAKDEFLLQWKSQKELEWLGDTIETVSCFLQDADKLQSKELSVQNCLARLKKVMYEADDFFDGLAWQALHEKTISGNAFKKEVHLWFSKLSKFKIAHEVKSIRESLDHIKADMVFHGFIRQSQPIGNQGVMRFDRAEKKTHSLVHEEDVIGRDQEREDIVNLLLPQGDTSGGRSFSVVAVIGFGGLGKTTLAQLVYNDERVKQGFDVCLWACVNYLSNLEQVLIEIIAPREGRLSNLGLERLQEKLREIIGRKKFLVVLDDVWDEDPTHWHSLETILRCGKVGSKALVTTRSHKVAKCLDASKPCRVDLGELSDESAWSLFVNKAFGQEGLNEHPELEPLGRKIVSSCGNVPLAIVVVGSLIRQREKEEKVWSHFLENELGKALAKSDGDGSQRSVVKDVLMVSYNDLLPHLKLCFAYCSLFPKDHFFEKDELVRLWLAQGFVKSSASDEQSLEEVGDDYFFHLVERCFFQEVKDDVVDGVTAKMHDLVHDVAIDVSKTDVILFDKDLINKRKMDSLRHISVDSEVVGSLDYCNLVSEPNTVRTLLFQGTCETNFQISQGSLDMLVKSFRFLRTLSLSDQGIVNVSSSIGELIHLRYLDLSYNRNLKHLPKSICRLHNLMTLELRGCDCLEKLPPKIEKLVSLRQLCIKGCEKLDCLPPGLKALTSLVNLDRLIVHCQSGGLGYMEGLDNLCGVLRIELPEEGWPCAVEDAKRSNMSKKYKLSRMVIEWKRKGSHTEQEMGKDEATKVVEALEPHQTLEYLEISNYGGEKLPSWCCMLKNVKEIILYGCEHVEYIEDVMKDGLSLPSLETLEFCQMKNLKGWWRQEIPEEMHRRPCLAKVSRVTIKDCMKLVGRMPLFEGVEFLELVSVDVKLVAELLLSVNSSCSPHSSCIAPCGIINNANNKMKELKLLWISGLICLPEEWIRHLAALQRLEIRGRGAQRVSRRGLSHLIALKVLVLESDDCKIGDEEEDGDEKKDVDVGMPWKALRGLQTLTLSVGDRHLHEGLAYLSCLLFLNIGKWKGVQLGDGETLGVQLPSKALQNLFTLEIGFEDNNICYLPKAGIQHLHSLQWLSIKGCKELYLGWKTLPLKLKELFLDRVGSVINVEDDWVGDQPTQLSTLLVKDCKDMEWAHHIPWKSISSSLEWLILRTIGEMEELPDGIQHLTSLYILDIYGCEKLKSVPTWLPHLTSLETLYITFCSSEMKRRCERERGEDWPLIRHIPNIFVKARELAGEEKEAARKIGWCGLTR